jgi:peptide/nickel transport system substrate-binding protein
MKKRLFSLTSLALAAALMLTACGGGAGTAGTGQKAGDSAAKGGAKTITVAQAADAVTLDPQKTNDTASANPMQQIYNTLIDLTPDMQLKPALAEEWKQVDDYTWEFKLRKGVKFHNGEELKASDVKFTYDRLLDPKTSATPAFLLASVKEVKVVDDYTVQLVTKEKFAPILYNLTHIGTAILNEKAVKETGDNYGVNPVGTGPFKFVKWDKSSQIVLEQNKDYFEGPAKLDAITFRIIPEAATSVAELRTGGVDVVLDLPPQQVKQFDNSDKVTVDKAPSFALKYLGFDQRQKPFDNVKVRQAVNYAIDKEALVKGAYQGIANVSTGPLAPGINGFNENLKGYEYNPEKAKELLKEAGYPNGFKTTLYLSDKEIDSKLGTIIQSQLKEVGINVNLQVIEWGAFLAETAKGLPMYLLSWTTVTGDADNGMYALFHSKNQGQAGNRTFYAHEEVDKLLDTGRTESDPATRVQAYQKAQEIIYNDAVWAFLTTGQSIVARNKRVHGFVNMPTQNYKFYPVSVE